MRTGLWAWAAVVLAVAASGACATVRTHGAYGFQVRCNVPEALVVIDDVVVGRAADWGKPGRAIRPGFHRVEIRHPGYYRHYSEIDARHGADGVIEAHLHAVLE